MSSTKSSYMLRLNGAFKFIASSLDAEIVRSKKMVKYIRLLLVGSFLLWSIRMITPRRMTWWKSLLSVKSSKTWVLRVMNLQSRIDIS